MEYGSPTPFVAFALAVVSGTLLAIGSYVGGAICAVIAVVLLGLQRYSDDHGGDNRHTLW